MKTKKVIRTIEETEIRELCYLHRQIEEFVAGLNQLPDAAAAKKQKPRSAPIALLEMVF